MVEKTKDNRSRFERQRRNLMAISATIIAYLSLGLELKSLNILGNTFTISTPHYLKYLLWSLLVYSLVRYWQFFNVINNREFQSMRDAYMKKYVELEAIKQLSTHPPQTIRGRFPDAHSFQYKPSKTEVTLFPKTATCNLTGSVAATKCGTETGGSGSFKEEVVVSGKQLLWLKIKSSIKFYLTTPHLSEYFLPLVLASLAVLFQIII